jgi:hypothetical protein
MNESLLYLPSCIARLEKKFVLCKAGIVIKSLYSGEGGSY